MASYAIDSVDLYVQEIEDMHPNSPDLEQNIHKHYLMQKELYLQRKAIHQLLGLVENERNEWKTYMLQWRNPKHGCLDE